MDCLETANILPMILLFFSSVGNDTKTTSSTFSNDLTTINSYVFQLVKIFNSDLNKEVCKVMLSRTIKKLLYPTPLFNNIPLNNRMFQKYLSLRLYIKLNFSKSLRNITLKNSKTNGLLRKFQPICYGHLF